VAKRKPYAFRREDNGKVAWVDFETMMEQQAGFITLPDGVEARRCIDLEHRTLPSGKREKNIIPPPAVSDSLGFPIQALGDKEAQRKQFGCTDIEFRPDPVVPGFVQVHGTSRAALDRYTKKRGLANITSSLGSGAMLSQVQLDRAAEMVSR
jgi:hypothetical protein